MSAAVSCKAVARGVLALLGLAAGPALAQEPAGAPPSAAPPAVAPPAPGGPPPASYGYPPPYAYPPPYGAPPHTPPAVVNAQPAPGHHLHDGFFLRLATGVMHTSLETSRDGQTLGTIAGTGMAVDITIGGALRPGLILAGSIHGGSFPRPSFTTTAGSTSTPDQTLQVSIGSLFVDFYPNPAGGLHFGGDAGFGTASLRNNETRNQSTNDPVGFAGGLHFGHEWWISPKWSFGVMGQVTYLHLVPPAPSAGQPTSSTPKLTGLQPTIVGTFTFN